MPAACVVVMAREPRVGAVKTRLAAAIGGEQAAALYAAFLADTVAACRVAGVTPLISYARDAATAGAYFARAYPDLGATPQPDADFGARLASAMHAGFSTGAQRVAVIGSDIPHISPAEITQAFGALATADVALGPTLDGGYYLIATTAPRPALFHRINWSSGEEFAQTVARAASLGLRVAYTATTFDVDALEDVRRLQDLIAARGAGACPATARALPHALSQLASRAASR